MGRNIELKINIQVVDTDAPQSDQSSEPQRQPDGSFRLVLDGAKSLDIDALEQGMLQLTYPALRHSIASVLQNEVKKMPYSMGPRAVQSAIAQDREVRESGTNCSPVS